MNKIGVFKRSFYERRLQEWKQTLSSFPPSKVEKWHREFLVQIEGDLETRKQQYRSLGMEDLDEALKRMAALIEQTAGLEEDHALRVFKPPRTPILAAILA